MITTAIKPGGSDFLSVFTNLIPSKCLDEHSKTKLDLFMLNINANEFAYDDLKNKLLDPVIDFALSRKVKEKYKNNPGIQSKKAREKFKKNINTGELGEFLLFCFLETHLNAPKILTKLELKTSTNTYVHGSDGVHFLKLKDGNYQLIFGESKTVRDLTDALTQAFGSISDFKKGINKEGKSKSGLPYEKSLINDELEKETFTDEEKAFIEKIIYPTATSEFSVDDAFGIFIGYEIDISEEDKELPNQEFRTKIQKEITAQVEARCEHILSKIKELSLLGHHFYIYVLPFTNLESTRTGIREYITS